MHSLTEGNKDQFKFSFQFLISSRLDNGSTSIFWITNPPYISAFSNRSIIPVTAPVVKPVRSASLPAGIAPKR